MCTFIHKNNNNMENQEHRNKLNLTTEHLEVNHVKPNTVSDLSAPQVYQPYTNALGNMLKVQSPSNPIGQVRNHIHSWIMKRHQS